MSDSVRLSTELVLAGYKANQSIPSMLEYQEIKEQSPKMVIPETASPLSDRIVLQTAIDGLNCDEQTPNTAAPRATLRDGTSVIKSEVEPVYQFLQIQQQCDYGCLFLFVRYCIRDNSVHVVQMNNMFRQLERYGIITDKSGLSDEKRKIVLNSVKNLEEFKNEENKLTGNWPQIELQHPVRSAYRPNPPQLTAATRNWCCTML